MSILADTQQLEPGSKIDLYELDAEPIGGEIYRFHPYGGDVIVFDGLEYGPWGVEATGFETTGGSMPTPRLKMADVGGFISALCLSFDDLVGATLTRRRTMAKYLDGQPEADPDEQFPPDIWYVEQRLAEVPEYVEFELTSALNFDGVEVPGRQIIQNYCPWRYRSADCGYTGPPVADKWDIITTDASRDDCGKRVQSCKLRDHQRDGELPFGGFPAAGLAR